MKAGAGPGGTSGPGDSCSRARLPPPDSELAERKPGPDVEGDVKGGVDSKWKFSGYGTIFYENYDWETHADRRARTDVERILVEAEYQPIDKFKVEVEVALEHGGVGAATEFDVFEEFGEFEQEIEKGGEIELEKAYAEILFSRALSVKFGHVILPVGLLNQRHKPSQYFTAARDATASPLIPVTWHENGVGIFGELDPGRFSGKIRIQSGREPGLRLQSELPPDRECHVRHLVLSRQHGRQSSEG